MRNLILLLALVLAAGCDSTEPTATERVAVWDVTVNCSQNPPGVIATRRGDDPMAVFESYTSIPGSVWERIADEVGQCPEGGRDGD